MPLILNGQTGVKITDAAGKIGIGTTNPGSRLTVSRDSEAAEGQIQLRNTGGISAGNYDGIFFTQGSTGQTPLASMRVKYQNNGHPDIGFFTRNTSASTTEIERVGISNAGYVTMPYQPAFDVASTVGVSPGNTQTYNTVYVNRGGHFNTSTSRFTAPVTGAYKFQATTIKAGASTGLVGRLVLRLNGSILYGNRHLRLSEGSTYGTNGVATWIVNMNPGDYVNVEMWISGGTGSHSSLEYTYFSGHLIG